PDMIYTLSLHDALPISTAREPPDASYLPARRFLLVRRLTRIALRLLGGLGFVGFLRPDLGLRRLLALEAHALSLLVPACIDVIRSEEHTSELQSRENLV